MVENWLHPSGSSDRAAKNRWKNDFFKKAVNRSFSNQLADGENAASAISRDRQSRFQSCH